MHLSIAKSPRSFISHEHDPLCSTCFLYSFFRFSSCSVVIIPCARFLLLFTSFPVDCILCGLSVRLIPFSCEVSRASFFCHCVSKGVPFLAKSPAHTTMLYALTDKRGSSVVIPYSWMYDTFGWVCCYFSSGGAGDRVRKQNLKWLSDKRKGTENLVGRYPAHLSSSKPVHIPVPLTGLLIIRSIVRVRNIVIFMRWTTGPQFS